MSKFANHRLTKICISLKCMFNSHQYVPFSVDLIVYLVNEEMNLVKTIETAER